MTVIMPEIELPVPTNMSIPSTQCTYSVEQAINAPIDVVWSLIRQFHNPKAYKMFISSSSSSSSSNTVGSFRNITHISGFPSTTSIERLDELNDDTHVMGFSLVGGDHSHRLANYQGTISLQEETKEKVINGQSRTVVTETYTVDVPDDSNEEDTCSFVNTLVEFNLKSLTRVAESIIIS